MKHKLVYIKWVDSCILSRTWTNLEELECDLQSTRIDSIGWLVDETEVAIHIAPHFGIEPDQVVGSICIPKCSILENVPIDLEWARKKASNNSSGDTSNGDT